MEESGFIVTPSEISDRVQGVDRAIGGLDVQITASREPRVNAAFRQAWRDFTARWQMVRDSFQSWGSRLSASRAMPVLDDWSAAFRRWLADFQQRIGGAAAPPAPALPPTPSPTSPLTISAPGPRFTMLLLAAAVGALATFILLRPRAEVS
jgi:hypothetical protein